ncbi:MAG: metallophosphoesterase family protein [Bacteroidetes bacterium]|nr:metallophosphoesterase family protein [Bacteroidota bacterium]MBK7970156.1 metallophosphoesterase family protein [Bacteroidota bacterium]
MKVLLLSDTHSYLDDSIIKYTKDVDEIWHAGDFGNAGLASALAAQKPLRGVYGNIDGQDIRQQFPLELFFIAAGVRVLMIHIGGYPGKFPESVKQRIRFHRPDLFICGHSHILKVVRDKQHGNMLCVNPGAAGKQGFQQIRTMIRMELEQGKIASLEVIELGPK